MPWIVVVLFLPLLGYGALNLFAPQVSIRWQQRATARRSINDPRAQVGTLFQGWFGVDPSGPPTTDAVRRVRIFGVVEIAVCIAFIAGALALA